MENEKKTREELIKEVQVLREEKIRGIFITRNRGIYFKQLTINQQYNNYFISENSENKGIYYLKKDFKMFCRRIQKKQHYYVIGKNKNNT